MRVKALYKQNFGYFKNVKDGNQAKFRFSQKYQRWQQTSAMANAGQHRPLAANKHGPPKFYNWQHRP